MSLDEEKSSQMWRREGMGEGFIEDVGVALDAPWILLQPSALRYKMTDSLIPGVFNPRIAVQLRVALSGSDVLDAPERSILGLIWFPIWH